MMMGIVLVMVSFVVGLNTSMMQNRKAGYTSSFFEDMRKIYEMSPLLQAHVQSKIPDLKCNFEKLNINTFVEAVKNARTEVLLVLYWAYYFLNIFAPAWIAGDDENMTNQTGDDLDKIPANVE
jgi:hypothetical protein